MKYNYLCYLIVYCLVISISCKGQKKSDRIKTENNSTSAIALPAEAVVNDNDPYFIESTATNSPYGPSSITRSILQDKKGNMWFATWEGIMQYDGKTFTNYTNKEGLRRWHVFSILEDRSGAIWFGTIGAGVYRYEPNATGENFTNYTTEEGLIYDRSLCFYEDKTGVIWIGTEGGISLYEPSSDLKKTDDKLFRNLTTKDGLTNNDINSIIEDKNGRMWIGTRGEACYYENGKFTRFLNADGTPFINVRSIIEDKNGHIWFGGNDGLWSFDPVNENKDGSIGTFTQHSTKFAGYIFEARNGSIWTSSVGENDSQWVLTRRDRQLAPMKGFNSTQIKIQDGQLFGISEDNQGNIWFGHERGICRLAAVEIDAKEPTFECFRNQN